jgi:FAD/FMN-containing dehydrogenase
MNQILRSRSDRAFFRLEEPLIYPDVRSWAGEVSQIMKRRDFCRTTALGGAWAVLPSFFVPRGFAADSLGRFRDTPSTNLSGETSVIPAKAIKDFAASLQGQLVTSSHADYEQARRLWNKMFDERPALIAQCSGAADVAKAIQFGRERDLLVAVRGGGHSYQGYSTCNGGLVIDLSSMRNVRVDPSGKRARADAGAWIRDLDRETQHYGLATPMGTASNTGIAGLTLGGGYGRLSRQFGLACDNLISADLVTADGKSLRVSATDTPDLFWALRGGGGNFGVVTSFEYQLHPVATQVFAGELTYAPDRLKSVLEYLADYAARAPRELSLGLGVMGDEPRDKYPVLYFCFAGDRRMAEKTLQSLRTETKPREDNVRGWEYVTLQSAFDGPPHAPFAEYVKSAHIDRLTPALIEAIMAEHRSVGLAICGGAIADVAPTETAIANRRELFQLAIRTFWEAPSDAEKRRAEIEQIWVRLQPFITGFYANLTCGDQNAMKDNFGLNLPRLAQIKTQYDPHNFFRLNPNIRPS